MSLVLLQFLATNGSLTTEHVDALWEDTKDKHSSRHVFLQLCELSKCLEEELVGSSLIHTNPIYINIFIYLRLTTCSAS